MKAISIKQPFATLIALRLKQFESRSWRTHFRGEIAIHVSQKVDKLAYNAFAHILKEHGINSIKDLPTGCVIATANIVACHKVLVENYPTDALMHTGLKISGNEYTFGNYEEGHFAWELDNVNVFPTPIQAKGALSLWEWKTH